MNKKRKKNTRTLETFIYVCIYAFIVVVTRSRRCQVIIGPVLFQSKTTGLSTTEPVKLNFDIRENHTPAQFRTLRPDKATRCSNFHSDSHFRVNFIRYLIYIVTE